MKILVYTDVHGNKYALKNLQKSADYKNADLRIFLGDAVLRCPYPNECLQMIWKSGDIFVVGNHDLDCAFISSENATTSEHIEYMKEKILPEYRKKLLNMPKEYYVDCFGKKLFFAHYPWVSGGSVMDIPARKEKKQKTVDMFKNVNADYIIYGHDHTPAKFECDGKTFVCVGSLGLKHPGHYIVINIDETGVNIENKVVFFDVKKLKSDILKKNYPEARDCCKSFK